MQTKSFFCSCELTLNYHQLLRKLTYVPFRMKKWLSPSWKEWYWIVFKMCSDDFSPWGESKETLFKSFQGPWHIYKNIFCYYLLFELTSGLWRNWREIGLILLETGENLKMRLLLSDQGVSFTSFHRWLWLLLTVLFVNRSVTYWVQQKVVPCALTGSLMFVWTRELMMLSVSILRTPRAAEQSISAIYAVS